MEEVKMRQFQKVIMQVLNLKKCILLVMLFSLTAYTQDTTSVLEWAFITSPALEDNWLGDSNLKKNKVYLPKAYQLDTVKTFPVLYLLPSFSLSANACFSAMVELNLQDVFDDYFDQNPGNPFIIVVVDGKTECYNSGWYVNSWMTGDYEDYVIQELIPYIDANYRTRPYRASRGIAGHSTGGYGAIMLAMKHADKFGWVYGLSPAGLDFEDIYLRTMKSMVVWAIEYSQTDPPTPYGQYDHWMVSVIVTLAMVYSPDFTKAEPYCSNFPITSDGTVINAVWEKWLLHDPIRLVDNYKANLASLLGIKFDCGDMDNELIEATKNFSQKLTDESITHTFDKFEGDHSNHLFERMTEHMLPFMFTHLVDIPDAHSLRPGNFQLYQNYPNPFNPRTVIRYQLPAVSKVNLSVYNTLGQKVATLVNEKQPMGSYEVDFDGSNLASGIYFYRLQVDDFSETKKMVLIK